MPQPVATISSNLAKYGNPKARHPRRLRAGRGLPATAARGPLRRCESRAGRIMTMTKLATFTDAKGPRVGAVLPDGGMLDLSAAAPGGALSGRTEDMLALIEGGPAALTAGQALAANPPPAAVLAAGGWTLLAPIPKPRRNVFCVGRNYKYH